MAQMVPRKNGTHNATNMMTVFIRNLYNSGLKK
jgi:hypothetical protein